VGVTLRVSKRNITLGLRFPAQIYGKCFFVTTSFKNWEKYGKISGFYAELAASLIFCLKKYDGRVLGYVFMPDHIHLLLFIDGDKLSNLIRDFKKYTSQKTAVDLGLDSGGLWSKGYDRQEIYSTEIFNQKLEYIHYNPVKKKLVTKSENWRWSSAIDYMTENNGPIPVWMAWI
jgi:REP element-mobilizing transposase RayT